MFVGLLVCPLFIGHTRFPTLRRCLRVAESRSRRRASGQAHALARARARMPYNFSTKKSLADAFQKQLAVRARMLSYTYLPRFSKKGKKKTTCHFQSLVYSLPSLGVFTFRIVLNRILHKSSLLAPMESRRTRRPTFTAKERLERRREQDRRRHAESQLLFHYQKFFVE